MIEDGYFVIVALFLTYLDMEALEHHTESKARQWEFWYFSVSITISWRI